MTTTANGTPPATDTARIPELEAWLDIHGVPWRLAGALPIDQVDAVAGLANQARLTTLDEATVDRYTADMEAGAAFPPIVVRQHGNKLVPVGGNHRIAAARKAGRHALAAYVLPRLSDDVIHLLAIEDNRRHGLPLSDEERLYHAISLVNGGRTNAEAASICGIPSSKVGMQVTANRGTRRAINLDADGWAALSTSAKARLAAITSDDLFTRVVPLAASGAIKAIEVTDVVSRLNAATPDRAAEMVDALEADAQERTRRTGGAPVSKMRAPATRLLHDLDVVCDYDPALVAADCRSDAERNRLGSQIKAAARRLMAIEKELWG